MNAGNRAGVPRASPTGNRRVGGHLDGPGHQAADEVHEAQLRVAVSDQSSSG